MNLLCFGHLPWSPMKKRNQSMVFHFNSEELFNKIIFINPYVRITDIFLKFSLQTKNIIKTWSWKRIFPSMVEDKIIAITTLFIGPDQVFRPFNKLLSILYICWIKSKLGNENFCLLLNDFEPDRELFYRKLILKLALEEEGKKLDGLMNILKTY